MAAALGYGLTIDRGKNILVIDFGGGTLDFALIRTEEKTAEKGHGRVITKEGIPVGGNLVDSWILERVCEHYDYNFEMVSKDPQISWWFKMLLAEACRIKESLFFNESDTFYLLPSGLLSNYLRSIPGNREKLNKPLDFTRDDLIDVLETNGLYAMIDSSIDSILETASTQEITNADISDVLLVGGSTLLPKVYSIVEKRFGRDRVRAWQPFNAVAFGAAAFAANKITTHDHITHDYALITYDKETHKKEYNIIVPRGTHFPTPRDFWKRQLVPTCALGVPERIFKLIIYEIGKKHTFDQEFIWDEKGNLHTLNEEDEQSLIIPLNEDDPTLGYLDPPHHPSDKRSRVEISFMIDEDKWLCATVYDLKIQKYLLREKPVIRLQ